MDIDRLRRLASTRGTQWGGVEDLSGQSGEPPTEDVPPQVSRRDLLRLMGASMALMGVSGCERAPEALPYVNAPENIIPGRPKSYASAWVLEGWAQPVLGTTWVGRPTKLEGNPDHPASRGATDAFTQASILTLYDPDRSQTVLNGQDIATWEHLLAVIIERLPEWKKNGGRGLRVLSGAVTSPTLIDQMEALLGHYPEARWHGYEPVGTGNRSQGLELAFGGPLDLHLRLDRAKAIVSFDEDMLGFGPTQTLWTAQWGEGRRAGRKDGAIPVVHTAESIPGLLGALSDHRLAAKPSRMPALLLALSARVEKGARGPSDLAPEEDAWVRRAAEDLRRFRGQGLIVAGRHLPPESHALTARLNHRLRNVETTLAYSQPLAMPIPKPETSLAVLARDMDAGEVETLVILDSNPVYTAPADLEFSRLLQRVKLAIHVGLYADETARACHWHVPLLHPFESWGDARAVEGTATIIQPLVQPLFAGLSAMAVINGLMGKIGTDDRKLVRGTWAKALDDSGWREALGQGLVSGSAALVFDPGPPDRINRAAPAPHAPIEITLRPDTKIWDGRLANVAWLQEMGDPLTKVTWENVATLSPRTAESLGVGNGEVVGVATDHGRIEAPIWILPGQAEGTLGLTLGYGRSHAGQVGSDIGYDATRLRTEAAPWTLSGSITRTGRHVEVAQLQTMPRMAVDNPVLLVKGPEEQAVSKPSPEQSMFPPWPNETHAWAMSIDLDLCTGCNACVVACQAENNVPTVGKDEVAKGRPMHWVRIDRYYQGALDNPEATLFQPVPCMHCENAPCEIGCPVYAAVHSSEGINEQVYNRCIGTRTCAVYCPYAVRRFNFYTYSHVRAPLDAQYNPEVTVRARGVMEKCTYCIQRIEVARIQAADQNRTLGPGDVQTACQQVCPSRVITFGDLNDPNSSVSKGRADPRSYALLGELNTRPRTTYLARIRPKREV